MPELPEVEMAARHLKSLVAGKTILKAQLLRAGLAPENSPRQFAVWLKNAGIVDVTRRGKHLLAHLSNGRTLLTHLRMTGRFVYLRADEKNEAHTHAVFHLDDGHKLLFTDQRHFGMMQVAETATLSLLTPLAKLAPEPFDPAFSTEYLFATLQRSRQAIKTFLLDQTRVVGLGNIYAAEALHRAKIDPRLSANQLSYPRAARLREQIVQTLSEAIEVASRVDGNPLDPRNIDGSYFIGTYEKQWRVYDREGLPCGVCGALVERLTQGTRSTYFCPRCQDK